MKRFQKMFLAFALFGGLLMGMGCGCNVTGASTVTYMPLEGTKLNWGTIGIGFMADDCGIFPTSFPFAEPCHKAKILKMGESHTHEFQERHTDRKLYVSCDTESKFEFDKILVRSAGTVKTKDGWEHRVTIDDREHVTITTFDEKGNPVPTETRTLEDCKL